MNSYTTFGDLLKHLRLRAQLTQRELAIAVGYSEAQVSRLEANKRAPNPAAIRALFVPALGLEDEPDTLTRLLALAEIAQTADSAAGAEAPHPPSTSGKRHNLPAELTSLVGREADLAEVTRLLGLPTTRLLTLTGSGGCGKTRLALRVGCDLGGRSPNGTWWVELASLADPFQVPQAVVNALGLVTSPDHPPVDVLTAYFQEHPLLLILDNCEHLIEAVARLALDLLSDCPALKILVTSREPLGVPGEITYRVPSLTLPPADWDGKSESSAAARLFLERANSLQPGFTLAEGESPALARICRRLDGIPLAIELAAARVNVLTLPQLADRLEESFRVLGYAGRGTAPRHATLSATVAWSYHLLPESERVLLRWLPLFAGSWTLEQAEEICAADEVEQEEMLEHLAGLVRKSLVNTARLPDRSMRYRLHEMVRQYALERLGEAGEEEELRRRFLDYFIRLVEEAEPELKGPRQLEWLDRLDQEHTNITQALSMAVSAQDGLSAQRLASGLDYYWQIRDLCPEAVRWLDAALAIQKPPVKAQPEILRARARVLLSMWNFRDFKRLTQPQWIEMLRECEQIYQSLDDRRGQACLLLAEMDLADMPAQVAYADQITAVLPEVLAAGDHWTAAHLLISLDSFERSRGNFSGAHVWLEGAAAHARIAGDQFFMGLIFEYLAWAKWDLGQVREAKNLAREAVRLYGEVGTPAGKAYAIMYSLASFCAALGGFGEVHEAMDEALSIVKSVGAYWRIPDFQRDLDYFHFYEGVIAKPWNDAEDETEITSASGVNSWRLYYVGRNLLYQGQVERAAELLTLAVQANTHAATWHERLRALGQVRLTQGALPAARDLLTRALAEISRNRTLPDFPETLDVLAQLVLAEGNPFQAAHLLGASDGLLRRMEMVRYPVFRPEYERCRAAACAALGEEAFAKAYKVGEGAATVEDPIEAVNAMLVAS